MGKTGKKDLGVSGEDLSYLDEGGDSQVEVLDAMANRPENQVEKFQRNYGSREWKLLSGYRNLVENYESIVHGMELATGVLVKSLEMRGHGGVSSSFVFMAGYHLEFDSKGDQIWSLEFKTGKDEKKG